MVISSNIIKSQKIQRILMFYLILLLKSPSNDCVNGTLMTRLPAGRQGLPQIRKHPLPARQACHSAGRDGRGLIIMIEAVLCHSSALVIYAATNHFKQGANLISGNKKMLPAFW